MLPVKHIHTCFEKKFKLYIWSTDTDEIFQIATDI